MKMDNPIDYVTFVKFCMKSMAMMPAFGIEGRFSLAFSFLNYAYYIFVDFISLHMFAFSVVYISHWDGAFVDVLINLVHTIIYAVSSLLLLYFQFYAKDMIRLFDVMNQTFKFKSAEGMTEYDMIPSYTRAKKSSQAFTVACLVGALHWAVMPLLNTFDGVRTLPVNVWYPFDSKASPYYEIVYLLQVFAQTMVALTFSNFGVFFMTECMLICGQFDILMCSLRNLRFTALLRNNYPIKSLAILSGYDSVGPNRCTLPEDENKSYFVGKSTMVDPDFSIIVKDKRVEHYKLPSNWKEITYNSFDDEILKAIKECVVHHQEILDYCDQFESFINPIMLVKMFQITILACFVMYAFSESFQMAILEYMLLTCTDLFLLCFFANEVSRRSRDVGLAACEGPWQTLGIRSLKSLIPMMIRAETPVRFTGGKFYRLSLETFIAVLKGSFSYFTMLRNVNDVTKK